MSQSDVTPPPVKGQPGLEKTLKALAARLESGPAPDLDELSEALYAIRSGDFDKGTKKMLLEAREGVDEGKSPDPLVMRMLAKAAGAAPGAGREDRITPVRGVPVTSVEETREGREAAARFFSVSAPPLPAPPVDEDECLDTISRTLEEAVEPEPDLSPSERAIMEAAPVGKKRGRPPGKKNGNGNGNGYVDPLPPVPFEPESLPEPEGSLLDQPKFYGIDMTEGGRLGFAGRDVAAPLTDVDREVFSKFGPLKGGEPVRQNFVGLPDTGQSVIAFEPEETLADHELAARAAELLLTSHDEIALALYDLASRLQRTPLPTDEPLIERAERAIETQISYLIESRTSVLPLLVLEWVKWKREQGGG